MNQHTVPLSDHAHAIILGSLLGDGSLRMHKGYANARFSFRHSETQKEYFLWKAQALKEISKSGTHTVQKADGYSKNLKLMFQSQALPCLTELYQYTHKRSTHLKIQRRWLNKMTALSLAIWWFDDGSLIANSRKGVFCTDGFDQDSVKVLARYFEKVWDIHTHVAPIGRKRDGKQDEYWRLWIRSTSELQKFLRIILPYVPSPSMLTKVLLLYKDRHLQERWISEVEEKTHFSKEIIEKALSEKRMKWKNFRE